MSWLKERAERKQAEANAEAAREAEQHRVQRESALAAQVAELRDMIDTAREFRGLTASELEDRPPVVLKKHERAFAIVMPVHLIEPRAAPGHWEGRSQAVSVRVPGTRSMRYRVGGSRGHYVKGEQVPTPIDTGTCVITDLRVVFTGPKYTREWLWAKTVSVDHRDDASFTIIGVSNRQKASGILYAEEQATTVRFRLDLALAVANDTTDELAEDLEADLKLLQESLGLPTHPLPAGTPLPPPSPPA